ncbi:MAG: hypothetical protein QF773_10605 [Lentisphaeria bacterium]|jgi:hypothetical protein|nr:hypothetical protein [Lentisphaeria bacterium]
MAPRDHGGGDPLHYGRRLQRHTLTYPFVFDDLPCIVDNDAVRVQALTGPELWKAA